MGQHNGKVGNGQAVYRGPLPHSLVRRPCFQTRESFAPRRLTQPPREAEWVFGGVELCVFFVPDIFVSRDRSGKASVRQVEYTGTCSGTMAAVMPVFLLRFQEQNWCSALVSHGYGRLDL
jgi:hypothetical protein